MYEYQERIQRIIWDNEDYWCIDNDKESEELQEVYKKAQAWDSLKELLTKEYPSVVHLADVSNGEGERGEMNKHQEVLEHMDKLDGTNEFSNLLHDMNRSGK